MQSQAGPLEDECTPPTPDPHRALHEAESAPDRETHVPFQKRKRSQHSGIVSGPRSKMITYDFRSRLSTPLSGPGNMHCKGFGYPRGTKIQGSDLRKTQEDFVSCQVTKLQPSRHLSAAATRYRHILPSLRECDITSVYLCKHKNLCFSYYMKKQAQNKMETSEHCLQGNILGSTQASS